MTSDQIVQIYLLGLQAIHQIPDEYEAMAIAHALVTTLKQCDDPVLRSKVIMSKEFTDLIEKNGYILSDDPKHAHKQTKGNFFTWLTARIATTK